MTGPDDLVAKARRVLAELPEPSGPPGRSPWMPDDETVEANHRAMLDDRAARAQKAKPADKKKGAR